MPPAAGLTFQDTGKRSHRVSSGRLTADPLGLVRLRIHPRFSPIQSLGFWRQGWSVTVCCPLNKPDLCLWSGRRYYSALTANALPANGYIVMRKSFLFTPDSVFLIFLGWWVYNDDALLHRQRTTKKQREVIAEERNKDSDKQKNQLQKK